MRHDLSILRAMLRLSWKRTPAHLRAIHAEAGGAEGELSEWNVRGALRRLDAKGLVELRPKQPARLTFAGFTLALSTVKLSLRVVDPPAAKLTGAVA